MKKILNSNQMKVLENNTIDNIGIDGAILMERASLSLTQFISEKFSVDKKILIVCGTGNNGADGLCLARQLLELGYKPSIYVNYGHSETDLFKKQKSILEKLDASFVESINDEYTLVVDALLGIGIKGNIDDKTKDLITMLNSFSAYKLSVDIPSGLNASSGQISPVSFKADTTITFGAYKSGLFYNDAVNYVGEVLLMPIGIWEYDCPFEASLLEESDLSYLKKSRINNSNKATYGKILLISGSKDMCGCAILSSKACLKTGSGMVKLITHSNNRSAINNSLPEAMNLFYENDILPIKEEIINTIEWADALICGPGLSTDTIAMELVSLSLEALKPLVLDADALNCISNNNELQKKLRNRCKEMPYMTVITPHKGESKRLLNAFSFASLDEMSQELSLIIVDKDARSRILGRQCFVNFSGNNGMSTAGSGDVLAGIVASFLGFYKKEIINVTLEEAVAAAVFIHGKAGDLAIKDSFEGGLIAGEIADNIPRYINQLP